jgi:Family of unknown function (DUF6519)/Carboxypeptidase regulatory-like domain/Right handed beta helix region
MGGDYTRLTFDPAKDYAELFKQQGRVDLDGDWNEFVEMVYRRWRAETIDIIGRAVVPESTHDAFLITPSGPGQFTIGVGRMYVDGLLAENHGLSPVTFDAALGELDGTTPIPFTGQPYYPNPKPLPSPGQAVDLIYLDVWQREVTAIQDPAIREKALGGPDTATRMQTVWQVKILRNVGQHDCGDEIAAWDTLVAPSAGRLTTSTVVPTPSPTPCILSPTGGYRGLENRLYRVEVHTAGTVGGATPAKFKWSRDNGSVVCGVNSISAPGGATSVVTLTSLGRDQVLRVKAGDWVEILDDRVEYSAGDFDGTNYVGQPGFLTQIGPPPDEANRTITVSPAIPAGLFDPTDATRHTRVRRWDQCFTGAGSDVDATTGLITVAAGPLDIEDGIQVSFSNDPAGGQLHVGDYWIFAARTADGSVEALQNAPPRGILHHYARLGFVTWAADNTGTFANCRQFWPPPFGKGDCTGCCTVTVGDGVYSQGDFINDIQGAVSSLGTAGGEVCLGRGVFTVSTSILIDSSKSKVTIRGMGWATKLIFTPDAQSGSRVLFDVAGTSHITLESFFAVARSAQAMVRITDSTFCAVRDTALVNLNISPATGSDFVGAAALSGRAIELVGTCSDLEIEKNLLLAAKGIVSVAAGAATGTGAINGAVSDVTGARIPNATVTLTKPDGTTQTTTTDATGKFAFPSLPAGNYTVSASAANFATAQQAVTVVANSTVLVNIVLQLSPMAATGASVVVTQRSDVRDISIRGNRILVLLSSIFLVKTEGCDIIGNQLLGLSADAIKSFGDDNLTRDNIDTFQQTVMTVLTGAPAKMSFQGTAIVLLYGARVTIAENQITGLVGVLAVFLSQARIADNQILALLALLVLNGLLIRLSGNFIAGILAGWIQAGLLLDFESSSNLWLGLYGMMFVSLAGFRKTYSPLFVRSLESAGLATSGGTVTDNVSQAVNLTGGSLGRLSVVALVKIHHEVFLTFLGGIVSQAGVFSGDVTISDNSFELCAVAGISWKTLPVGKILGILFQPIHVVERNTMNVLGIGVLCNCGDGIFRSNTIRCPERGFDLTCQFGRAQENSVEGTATQSNNWGLITVRPLLYAEQRAFAISGNRLQNGQGHGILIDGKLNDLVVENNLIRGMAFNGISTSTSAIYLQTVRISANDIANCQGGDPNLSPGSRGAIILPDVQINLMVHGNRLTRNTGIGMYLNGTFAYAGDVPLLRLMVQDNSQDGNGKDKMVIAAGYAVQFIGNQCIEKIQAPLTHTLVDLNGQWIIVTGNTVLRNQPAPGQPSLALFPYSSSSAIATSNILNGEPQINGSFDHLVTTPNISV